jgi:mutator protein MutT
MQNANSTKFTDKIAVAIMEQNGKYFIAQRSKKDAYENLWEFPGGKQEENETILECLKRELFEELGITATIGDYVCSSFFERYGKKFELLAFKVKSFTGTIECKEHKAMKWVSVDELDQYAFPSTNLVFIEAIKKNF